MAQRKTRFRDFERYIILCLSIATVLFIAFLSAAGAGNLGLKIFLAILVVAVCGYCLWLLYKKRELLRKRSLWLSVWAICMIICILASVILNYPSPNIYR